MGKLIFSAKELSRQAKDNNLQTVFDRETDVCRHLLIRVTAA